LNSYKIRNYKYQFSGIRFYDLKRILDTTSNYSPDFDIHPFRTSDFYDDENFFAQEIIENYPNITKEDIEAALNFGSYLSNYETYPYDVKTS